MLNIAADVSPEGAVKLALTGDLTEDADLARIHPHKGKEIHFDLQGVRRINSMGVREWVTLMAVLDASGAKLLFDRCSAPFVIQVNMIANFCGKGAIRSFHVPYTCEECGQERQLLWDLEKDRNSTVPETIPCENCKGTMEMDELPQTYLTFLK